MNKISRRDFHRRVGGGMLLAGLGSTLAGELGISTALAAAGPKKITFGDLDSLVGLMQDTPLDKLQPLIVGKLRKNEVDHAQLLQAAALANAPLPAGLGRVFPNLQKSTYLLPTANNYISRHATNRFFTRSGRFFSRKFSWLCAALAACRRRAALKNA